MSGMAHPPGISMDAPKFKNRLANRNFGNNSGTVPVDLFLPRVTRYSARGTCVHWYTALFFEKRNATMNSILALSRDNTHMLVLCTAQYTVHVHVRIVQLYYV